MLKIKFSEWWNKLQSNRFIPHNQFTTIRGYSPRKYKYYKDNEGAVFEIIVEDKSIGTARLISVAHCDTSELTTSFKQQDTYNKLSETGFGKLMERFYGLRNIHAVILDLIVEDVYNRDDRKRD